PARQRRVLHRGLTRRRRHPSPHVFRHLRRRARGRLVRARHRAARPWPANSTLLELRGPAELGDLRPSPSTSQSEETAAARSTGEHTSVSTEPKRSASPGAIGNEPTTFRPLRRMPLRLPASATWYEPSLTRSSHAWNFDTVA